ncbi:MAG: DAK2 domain-containing protein [Symploca sp. SIO3E6]|nr:DAK2 domain-containing protein [Caldora sp. SIO3E6]
MQSEQKQQIMGYFIEETKEHLCTMEQAFLDLPGTMEDKEVLNEAYRAAHSIKGGAAMLELNSIQKTAHHLEDCLKDLKESPVETDQYLQSLFVRVLDTLQNLVEQLQEPSGLTDEVADEIMTDIEPVLAELSNYIKELQQSFSSVPEVNTPELVLAGHSLEMPPQEEFEVAASMSLTDFREQELQDDSPKIIYPDTSLIQVDEDSGIIFAQPIPDEISTTGQRNDGTKSTSSKRGRASYTGERSKDTYDAGAVAVATMLENVATAWEKS